MDLALKDTFTRRYSTKTFVMSSGIYAPVTRHPTIQCDGCGQSPLIGKRYRSVKKYNYDLCSSCFAKETLKDHYAIDNDSAEQAQVVVDISDLSLDITIHGSLSICKVFFVLYTLLHVFTRCNRAT